jgi:hypothetical protein
MPCMGVGVVAGIPEEVELELGLGLALGLRLELEPGLGLRPELGLDPVAGVAVGLEPGEFVAELLPQPDMAAAASRLTRPRQAA